MHQPAYGSIFRFMDRSKNEPEFGLQVAEDIVPIGEFKAHLSERLRELRSSRRPLVVTQNGRATAVVLSQEAFDRLTSRAHFIAAVEEGLAQADAGQVHEHEEVFEHLEGRLAKRKPVKRR